MEDANWLAAGIRPLPDNATTISVAYPGVNAGPDVQYIATTLNPLRVLSDAHASTDRFFIPAPSRPFKAVAVDLWHYLNDMIAKGMQFAFECAAAPVLTPHVYTCVLSWGEATIEQLHNKRPSYVRVDDICYRLRVPAQAVRYKASTSADWTHARWPFECTFILQDTGDGTTLEVRNEMRKVIFKGCAPPDLSTTLLTERALDMGDEVEQADLRLRIRLGETTEQAVLHANETWYAVHAWHVAMTRDLFTRVLADGATQGGEAPVNVNNDGAAQLQPILPKRIPKRPTVLQRWRKLYQDASPLIGEGKDKRYIADRLKISERTLTDVLAFGAWDEQNNLP